MRSSVTGTVEIKRCGFNTRPKLMVPDPASGGEESPIDVLPDVLKPFEGKRVKITIQTLKS